MWLGVHKCRCILLWHVIAIILSEFKLDIMIQKWQRLLAMNEKTHDQFRLSAAIGMILIFLAFWGVSFYILVNSFA